MNSKNLCHEFFSKYVNSIHKHLTHYFLNVVWPNDGSHDAYDEIHDDDHDANDESHDANDESHDVNDENHDANDENLPHLILWQLI